MNLIYKKADISNIDDIIDLKIKQSLYNCTKQNLVFENEEIAKENIKKVLLQELNKTIYFYVAIDRNCNKAIACNGFVIHQMVPSTFNINGKKAYITSVFTDEEYRCNGIQNELMKMSLDFLKSIECKKIELDADNPHAIKLYQKFGFVKDNEKYILVK